MILIVKRIEVVYHERLKNCIGYKRRYWLLREHITLEATQTSLDSYGSAIITNTTTTKLLN